MTFVFSRTQQRAAPNNNNVSIFINSNHLLSLCLCVYELATYSQQQYWRWGTEFCSGELTPNTEPRGSTQKAFNMPVMRWPGSRISMTFFCYERRSIPNGCHGKCKKKKKKKWENVFFIYLCWYFLDFFLIYFVLSSNCWISATHTHATGNN